MGWLCNFMLCRWQHLFNAYLPSDGTERDDKIGVYQCPRCKSLSLGAYR